MTRTKQVALYAIVFGALVAAGVIGHFSVTLSKSGSYLELGVLGGASGIAWAESAIRAMVAARSQGDRILIEQARSNRANFVAALLTAILAVVQYMIAATQG